MATTNNTISWTASEYIDHKQGFSWYLLLALATVGLAAGFYLLTKDYFGAGAIVLIGLAVGIFAHRTPDQLAYVLNDDGLQIQDKSYDFGQFKSFTIIQEGPISSIEFLPLKRFMPPISIFFATKDQPKIVAVLQNHLPYEERQLDFVERLSRRLHF